MQRGRRKLLRSSAHSGAVFLLIIILSSRLYCAFCFLILLSVCSCLDYYSDLFVVLHGFY